MARPHPSADAGDVVVREFATSFRGFDPRAVRAHLQRLADRLTEQASRIAELEAELAAARAAARRPVPLDEATVAAALGEEAARVLATAREGASQMKARAEERTAELLREAQAEASRIREEAELDAGRRRQEAAAAAEEEIEAAKQQGRAMLAEAQAVRERVLADLARRRKIRQAQLEALRAGRDRILEAVEHARQTIDDVAANLREADEEFGVAPEPITAEVPLVVEAPVIADLSEAPPPTGSSEDAEPPAPVGGSPTPPDASVDTDPDGSEPVIDPAEPAAPSAPVVPGGSEHHRSEVDELFARLRAERKGAVARAQAVLARSEPSADRADRAPAAADPVPLTVSVADDGLLARRDERLEELSRSLARRLKRVLADEQNELLDRLRRAGDKADPVEVLDAEETHVERYRAAAEDDLWLAATAGAEAAGLAPSAAAASLDAGSVLDAALDELGPMLVRPLRDQLSRWLEAGGDEEETANHVRAVYREWRLQRLDSVAADLLLGAYGRAHFNALPDGCPVRWMVDPTAPPCADADDNALASEVVKGTAFPTGHAYPPAHPGCRCHLLPVPE
jgi:hypothetical protein